MIPVLYGAGATTWSTNGLGSLADAITCVVTEERNGVFELTMTYPVTGLHYSDIAISRIIRATPADGKDPQPFRIYEISRPINGVVTIYARHISYQLSYIPVSPFSASSAAQAVSGLQANAEEDCPFEFWTDKETIADFSVDVPCSIRSRLGGVEGSILDVYGGEFEFDNYVVKLHSARGSDSNVTIRYGKNLRNVVQDENIESCITGILPYWYNQSTEAVVTLPEIIVSSDYADNFPFNRTVAVDFSDRWQDEPTEAQLRAAAASYVEANAVGVPKVSLTVDFVPLWQTSNYKHTDNVELTISSDELELDDTVVIFGDTTNIAPLERVNLCDTVRVYYEDLGIDAEAKVVATEYDVLSERYNSITIGDSRTNIADKIAQTSTETDSKIAESASALKKAIAHATDLITGNQGGYIVTMYNADGQPYELLITDNLDIDQAVKIWRWNASGLGYSSTGYDGEYGLAITADGAIVADFITTGTMTANVIKAGILMDAAQQNYWNMETGEFSLHGYAKSEDSVTETVIEYAVGSSSSVAPTSGWSSSSPTWTDGTYTWQRVCSVYGDGTTEYSDPVCIQGAKGADGTSVTINGYYDSLSQLESDHPTGTVGESYIVDGSLYVWSAGGTGYLQMSDGELAFNTSDSLEVYVPAGWTYCGVIQGEQGEQGETGLGYSSITPQYYLSTSNSTQTGGTWSTDQPTWTSGHYLWSRSYIVWTDGTTSTTTPYLEGAINSANELAQQAIDDVADLDADLDQQGVFNRLTQNGTIDGIFLRDNDLYINGSYVATGILTDATGSNWWNLETGELYIGTYATTSSMQTYVSSAVADGVDEAKSYADQIRAGTLQYMQSTMPEDPEENDVWYVLGDSDLYDIYSDEDLIISNETLVFAGDELEISYPIYHGRYYWWNGYKWVEIVDATLDDYPTRSEVTSEITNAIGQLELSFTQTLVGYSTTEQMVSYISGANENVLLAAGVSVDSKLTAYPTIVSMTSAIEASASALTATFTETIEQLDLGNHEFYQSSMPDDPRDNDTWYVDGDDDVNTGLLNLELSDDEIVFDTSDELTFSYYAEAGKYYSWDGDNDRWREIKDAALEDYPTRAEFTSTLEATAKSLTSTYKAYIDDKLTGYSTIAQTATEIYLTVEGYYTKTEIDQKADSLTLSATLNNKTATITLTGDGVTTQASEINFSGFATFTDLSGTMSTTINGANIATGTINAQKISLGDFTNLATVDERNAESEIEDNYYGGAAIEDGYIVRGNDSNTYILLCPFRASNFRAGEEYAYRFAIKADAAATAYFRFIGSSSSTVSSSTVIRDIASSAISVTTSGSTASGSITLSDSGTSTIANCKYAAFAISCSSPVYIKNLTIYKKLQGELIVDGAITTDKLAANAVTAVKIAANTITASQIASGTITATELASSSVTTAKLAASAVTSAKIAANTITADNIASGTITATELASSSVTTAKLAASAVTSAKIAASTITASNIASSAITADKLASSAVTTDKLAASAVTAAKIAANTITAAKLASGAITSGNISLYGNMSVYTSSSLSSVGGYIGYGSGYDGSTTTNGIKMTAGSNYVIVTSSGARLTAGGKSFYTISSGNYSVGNLLPASTGSYQLGNNTYHWSRMDADLVYAHGTSYISGNFLPSSSGTYNVGSSSYKFNYVYSTYITGTSSSDRRKKKDISYDLGGYNYLLDRLKPVRYKYTDYDSDMERVGLIAQDVEDTIKALGITGSGIVPTDKDGYKGLHYIDIIPLLVARTQEQWKINAELESRIQELQALVAELKTGGYYD